MPGQPEKLSKLLRRWRDLNGWKQWRAAEVLGVNPSTYQNWEQGKAQPGALQRAEVEKRMATGGQPVPAGGSTGPGGG